MNIAYAITQNHLDRQSYAVSKLRLNMDSLVLLGHSISNFAIRKTAVIIESPPFCNSI